jgi:hypothetical protein
MGFYHRRGPRGVGSDVAYLKSKLGVIGEEIYYHSHGAMMTRGFRMSTSRMNHSLSVGQVLLRDYWPSGDPDS